MKDLRKEIAASLLQIKAIKLSPANFFTWASGWHSPIYCDNRSTLSYPAVRDLIREGFVALIREKYPEADAVSGVATGAIAHGVLVAEALGLPFSYVRAAAKGHGLGNRIEGRIEPGSKIVVIEDLISTGGSSLSAVDALREAGYDVLGMAAIFSYGFPQSSEAFREKSITLDTLTDYDTLISLASGLGYIRREELETLGQWRNDPANWNK